MTEEDIRVTNTNIYPYFCEWVSIKQNLKMYVCVP